MGAHHQTKDQFAVLHEQVGKPGRRTRTAGEVVERYHRMQKNKEKPSPDGGEPLMALRRLEEGAENLKKASSGRTITSGRLPA